MKIRDELIIAVVKTFAARQDSEGVRNFIAAPYEQEYRETLDVIDVANAQLNDTSHLVERLNTIEEFVKKIKNTKDIYSLLDLEVPDWKVEKVNNSNITVNINVNEKVDGEKIVEAISEAIKRHNFQ